MVIFCVLFILILLQGHDCVLKLETHTAKRAQYLVNGEDNVCVFDNVGESRLTKCVEKPFDKELIFDFNFNEGAACFFINTNFKLFFPREYGKTSRIVHWRNVLPSDISSCPWRLPEYNDVVEIALDWVHDTVYAIDFGGKRLTGYRCHRPETPSIRTMNFSKDTDYIGRSLGMVSEQISLVDVQVDPYHKWLFIQLFIGGNTIEDISNSTIIVRTTLGATNYEIILDSFPSAMKFYVDVNNQTLYVWSTRFMTIYNYNGEELSYKSFDFKNTKKFVVFQNILHYNIFYGPDRVNHIGQFDLGGDFDTFFWDSASPSTVQLFGAERTIMLLDARSKRRMVNGTYLCDRTDCKDICEVLPTGDNCICKKSRAKSRDGLTCYDCGQSNLTTITDQLLIKGGQDASRADFPWHSTLYELKDGEWEQTCGGTLISPRVVLTAAHCVTTLYITKEPELKKTENLRVALGKIHRDWNITEPSEIRIRVKEIRPHEDFMGGTINYAQDIALLLLESKVNYTRFVMPACLDYNLNQLPHYSTLKAYVPGFGYMDECGILCSNQSKVLKYATTEVISFLDCFKASQAKNPSIFLVLTPDKFCIGNGSASAVQKGDSGGGLTLVHNGLHYVSGVVSIKLLKLSNRTSVSYSFGSFTNVTYNMDWLLRNLPEGE